MPPDSTGYSPYFMSIQPRSQLAATQDSDPASQAEMRIEDGNFSAAFARLLFGYFLLDDIDRDKHEIILSVIFVPVHRGPGLGSRLAWVESL